jgi:RNA polymerase sigma-70 factor (ECF subfamily)
MKPDSSDSLPTRASLLNRLRQLDDHESWRDFFHTYWRLIYGAAIRSGLNDAEAQDVVQETVIAVAKKMPHFRYDPAVDSFKGWLLYTTRKRIAGQFRKRQRERGESAADARLEEIADPAPDVLEATWELEWARNLASVALDRVRERVSPRQFQMFDLYVIKQWPVKEVAARLGVPVARVYLAKHRTTALMQQEIARLEKELR